MGNKQRLYLSLRAKPQSISVISVSSPVCWPTFTWKLSSNQTPFLFVFGRMPWLWIAELNPWPRLTQLSLLLKQSAISAFNSFRGDNPFCKMSLIPQNYRSDWCYSIPGWAWRRWSLPLFTLNVSSTCSSAVTFSLITWNTCFQCVSHGLIHTCSHSWKTTGGCVYSESWTVSRDSTRGIKKRT